MKSMTGYAARDVDGRRWELRSVNGRGLDLRLRLPDGQAALEPIARKVIGKTVSRGNITLSLKLAADVADKGQPSLSAPALEAALAALAQVETAAEARGLTVAEPSTAEILALRGLWEVRDTGSGPELGELTAELEALVAEFDAARAREGTELARILGDQIDQIAHLADAAEACLPDRARATEAAFRAALAKLDEAQVDEPRILQEIAVLAVKGDVAEELDRLRAHVSAARDLLATDGPVGRKLDFLTQEFNREANTLCAKSGHAELTSVGLEMKTVIDRLREQVQNVE